MTQKQKSKKSSKKKVSTPRRYEFNLDVEEDVDKIYKFLKNHNDAKLDVKIDGRTFKFASKISRQKFGEGFKFAYDVIFSYAKELADELKALIKNKDKEIAKLKEELRVQAQDIRVKQEVLKLTKLAWEDKIAEIELDREYLSNELKRLRLENSKKGDT